MSVQQLMMSYGVNPAAGYLNGLAVIPRAVLSIRKLISTATVSIRVRRSSDNAEQDIGFTGNALDTTSLASFVGANSAFVTTIYDQTGNGEDAVQSTAANQARIVNAGTYDGKLVFDGTNDGYKITSLTMGSLYLGFYGKIKQATGAARVIFETSAIYDSNAGSAILFADVAVYTMGMNNAGLNDRRSNTFPINLTTMSQLTVLYDRGLTGTNEIKAWVGGSAQTPTAIYTNETTGNFTTYDCFIGSRNQASNFATMDMDTMVFYNLDTQLIRSSIEALVA